MFPSEFLPQSPHNHEYVYLVKFFHYDKNSLILHSCWVLLSGHTTIYRTQTLICTGCKILPQNSSANSQQHKSTIQHQIVSYNSIYCLKHQLRNKFHCNWIPHTHTHMSNLSRNQHPSVVWLCATLHHNKNIVIILRISWERHIRQ